MQGQYISPHFITLDLTTQAGTYVKEFIHGDMGRTKPNLGLLMGCETDILQLDVLAIDLDFPPRLPNQPPVPNDVSLARSGSSVETSVQAGEEQQP